MRLWLIVFFFIDVRVHADAVMDVAGDLIGPPAARTTVLDTAETTIVWHPEGAATTRGILRIERHVPHAFRMRLERGTAEVVTSMEPALVLPKNFVSELMTFLWRTGDLRRRFEAGHFAAFTELRDSLTSLFMWPDLRQFRRDDTFAFDLEAEVAPKLEAPATRPAGGVSVGLSAPVRLKQWATVDRLFHPYVDFTGALRAVLNAEIEGDRLRVHLATELTPELSGVTAHLRAEFPRAINSWIMTSSLADRALEALDALVLNVRLPAFANFRARDIQQWQNSVRLPLGAL